MKIFIKKIHVQIKHFVCNCKRGSYLKNMVYLKTFIWYFHCIQCSKSLQIFPYIFLCKWRPFYSNHIQSIYWIYWLISAIAYISFIWGGGQENKIYFYRVIDTIALSKLRMVCRIKILFSLMPSEHQRKSSLEISAYSVQPFRRSWGKKQTNRLIDILLL